MSTFATLLVVPSIFAFVIGRKVARSPSICPEDPGSEHYDPLIFPGEGKPGQLADSLSAQTGAHNGHAAATTTAQTAARRGPERRRGF